MGAAGAAGGAEERGGGAGEPGAFAGSWRSWGQRARRAPTLALNPPGWGADFLAPVPAGVSTTIADLLDQVRSTPAEQAHREVAEALRRPPPADPRITGIL